MRLLFGLTYYRPYISGLTIYVQRLATELARRGHTVTVLTSCANGPRTLSTKTLSGYNVALFPIRLGRSCDHEMPCRVSPPLCLAYTGSHR